MNCDTLELIQTIAAFLFVERGERLLQDFRDIELFGFGKGVEPSGNSEILSDGFVAVFCGVGVHIKRKQADKGDRCFR